MSIYKNIYYKIESVRLWYFFDDGSYIELVSKELNYLVAILHVYAPGVWLLWSKIEYYFPKKKREIFLHF